MSERAVPASLGPAGRDLHARIWRDLGDAFELSERESEVLRLACVQVDRAAQLESLVEQDGVTAVGSRGQVRVHPAIAEARAAALAAGRLLGLLALPDGDEGVPRTAAQVRAARAASTRWKGARRG